MAVGKKHFFPPNSRFPNRRLDVKVPEVMKMNSTKKVYLVIQAPGNDITNLSSIEDNDLLLELCRKSNRQTIEVAENAFYRNRENLMGVAILPRPRRNDSRKLCDLQEYANWHLEREVKKNTFGSRIVVGVEKPLYTVTPPKLFGEGDQIHMLGKAGSKLYTECIILSVKKLLSSLRASTSSPPSSPTFSSPSLSSPSPSPSSPPPLRPSSPSSPLLPSSSFSTLSDLEVDHLFFLKSWEREVGRGLHLVSFPLRERVVHVHHHLHLSFDSLHLAFSLLARMSTFGADVASACLYVANELTSLSSLSWAPLCKRMGCDILAAKAARMSILTDMSFKVREAFKNYLADFFR